jgi:hypothetical protein
MPKYHPALQSFDTIAGRGQGEELVEVLEEGIGYELNQSIKCLRNNDYANWSQ